MKIISKMVAFNFKELEKRKKFDDVMGMRMSLKLIPRCNSYIIKNTNPTTLINQHGSPYKKEIERASSKMRSQRSRNAILNPISYPTAKT